MKHNDDKKEHLPVIGVGPIIVIPPKIDRYIEGNHLATTGVYSIVRNPIYSAFFLFLYRGYSYRGKYCFTCVACYLLYIHYCILDENRRKMVEQAIWE